MARHKLTSVYLVVYCCVLILCFGTVSGGYFGWLTSVKCFFTVCCDDKWIMKNFTGLETDLNRRLHGQHLVRKTVLGHIKAHFKSSSPSKALVLSFHGPTGVGKNFAARIVGENIYRDGMRNPFVHMISATKEFQHEGMMPFYKDKLKDQIEKQVKICERSMFIFDEVDKLPSQLLDVIKPYLDHYDHLGGIDYRKTVFIFLSNSGSQKVIDNLFANWKAGKKREDLELRHVEHDVMLSAINDERNGGLWHSHLISNSLVTAFIPFLPLEKEHVRQCIIDELLAKKYFRHKNEIPLKLIDEVINELRFQPETEQIFSTTGCKRVSEKIDFVMIDREDQVLFHKDSHIPHRQRDEI